MSCNYIMNKKNLQKLAGALGVPGRSKLNKAGLINAIHQHAGANPPGIGPRIKYLNVKVETGVLDEWRAEDYTFEFEFVQNEVYTCEMALELAMPTLRLHMRPYVIDNFENRFVDRFNNDDDTCIVEFRDPELGPFVGPDGIPIDLGLRRQRRVQYFNL